METRKMIVVMVVAVLFSAVLLAVIPWAVAKEGQKVSPEVRGEDVLSKDAKNLDSLQGSAYKAGEIIVKFKKAVADSIDKQLSEGKVTSELNLSISLDKLNEKYPPIKIEKIFKDFKKNRQRIEALKKKDDALLTKKEKHLVRRLKRAPEGAVVPDLGRICKIKLEPGQSATQAVAEYNKDPDVEYAELNYIVSIVSTEPNDPNYSVQWPLVNTGQDYPSDGKGHEPPGTPDCDIDANEAWDIHIGSSDVVVAVIDTGVDYTHRDLQNKMWTDSSGCYGYNYIWDNNDPMDDHGHGTHCAGIIGADSNNGLDIAGVSWGAKLMAVKFLDAGGSGTSSDAVLAISYAVDNGADITSNSWGGPDSNAVEDAFNYAYSQGVINVAGAGNNNSSSPFYPASYDSIIAVAATDSNDVKASFSNYGEWVAIAAPGTDILSLRAAGTSMGTPNNEYTTVARGTSMACPYVSGACALLLSVNPYITHDDANSILTDACSVDAIADGICASDGRLNVYKALLQAVTSAGYVSLDKEYFNCDCNIGISLADYDLTGNGTQDVNITTSGGDLETVTLDEMGTNTGVFTGEISTESGEPNSGDDILQVSDGETITVTYQDANDGTGNSASPNDTATVDCVDPNIISDVNVMVMGPDITVTFETNEFTLGRVHYGRDCNQTNTISTDFGTEHSIKLIEVSPLTDYYFKVTATDAAGNQVTDDNDSNCYIFTTTGPNDFDVPGDYNTIQEAINYSWDGGTVTVAEGTYNEMIWFKGRAVVLKSTDPNDWDVVAGTIIDSNNNMNVTVLFSQGEDANSVLSGFTVKNSGDFTNFRLICCYNAGPTISKCIIYGPGGNLSSKGIYAQGGSPIILNNNIIGNYGSGIGSQSGTAAIIKNNVISKNKIGISLVSYGKVNSSKIINNTIVDNTNFGISRGLLGDYSQVTISNCVLWGNGDDLGSSLGATYSCIEDVNDANGSGNITSDPCFVKMFDFLDITDANGTTTTIVVAEANLYEVNDVIEYNDDAVIRTVNDVNTTTNIVTFDNALDSNSVGGVRIHNWGPGVTDVNEDYHLKSNSPCLDAGDPNGDYSGQTDIDGEARVKGGRVDIGADEADCFPSCHPDYNEWVLVGKPWCWCDPRQCHGNADGQIHGGPKTGYYYVGSPDLNILYMGWQKPDSDPNFSTWICADFDHAKEGDPNTGYYRVGDDDLDILITYWKIREPPDGNGVDPNCLECN